MPLLDKISHAEHGHTSTLILVPTRELATQIDEQVMGFGYFVEASSIAIYGGGKGENWEQQKRALDQRSRHHHCHAGPPHRPHAARLREVRPDRSTWCWMRPTR
ncbi:MAG: DEAD/DEAH box helicase [Hymenobacter sp.]